MDSLTVLDHLTDDQIALLFKAIRSFHQGVEMELSFDMKMVFLPFKNQFIRDGVKYQETVNKRVASGKLGGLANASKHSKRKHLLKNVAKLAVSDSVSDSVNESETTDFSSLSFRVIDYLNRKIGSKYKPDNKKTIALIKARTKEGHAPEDFKKVIDTKTAQWINDDKMKIYLRPETLFGTKFESYLQEIPIKTVKPTDDPQGMRFYTFDQIIEEQVKPEDLEWAKQNRAKALKLRESGINDFIEKNLVND